jgi:hypothetical protein
MRVKPITLPAPMIQALLAGRKTQERQELDRQPPAGHELVGIYGPGLTAVFNPAGREGAFDSAADVAARIRYVPGRDVLWVRENFAATWGHRYPGGTEVVGANVRQGPYSVVRSTAARPIVIYYRADGEPEFSVKDGAWRSSIRMPRWASRLTLVVTDVRVQRLQEISHADCRAEGVVTEEWEEWREDAGNVGMPEGSHIADEKDLFRDLWIGINSTRDYDAWDANPWVAAYTFRPILANVDTVLADPAAYGIKEAA